MVFFAPNERASEAATRFVLSSLVSARKTSASATLDSARVAAETPLPQTT
jgi:hypothetical protein